MYTVNEKKFVEFTANMNEDNIKNDLDSRSYLFWNKMVRNLSLEQSIKSCYPSQESGIDSESSLVVQTKSGLVKGIKKVDKQSGVYKHDLSAYSISITLMKTLIIDCDSH